MPTASPAVVNHKGVVGLPVGTSGLTHCACVLCTRAVVLGERVWREGIVCVYVCVCVCVCVPPFTAFLALFLFRASHCVCVCGCVCVCAKVSIHAQTARFYKVVFVCVCVCVTPKSLETTTLCRLSYITCTALSTLQQCANFMLPWHPFLLLCSTEDMHPRPAHAPTSSTRTLPHIASPCTYSDPCMGALVRGEHTIANDAGMAHRMLAANRFLMAAIYEPSELIVF